MAKRKQINKNLVALLTVMGILLTVVVVALATSQSVPKDPNIWAERALQNEKAGDFEMAIRRWWKAYDVSGSGGQGKDVSYLIEMARVQFEWGDLMQAFATLQRARDEQPGNAEVMTAYLERLWQAFQPPIVFRAFMDLQVPTLRDNMLAYAQALQQRDEFPPIAPASEAAALWARDDAQHDPELEREAAAALERAIGLDATSTYVIQARIEKLLRDMQARRMELERGRAGMSEIEQLDREFARQRAELLQAGVEAHPADRQLVLAYADYLQGEGVRTLNAGNQPGAGAAAADPAVQQAAQEHFQQAEAVITEALAQAPDDPHFHYALAQLLFSQVAREAERLSETAYGELIDRVREHAGRALELEPALYDAYPLLARATLVAKREEALSQEASPERYEAALAVYEDGMTKTVGLHSLEETLSSLSRTKERFYAHAFHMALSYYESAADDEMKRERLSWAQRFLELAQVRYPEQPFTHYMTGELAMAKGERAVAIREFQEASARAKESTWAYPRMWFEAFGGVLPVHRLAVLYNQYEQPGEAMRYTQEAIERYEGQELAPWRGNAPAPLELAITRAQLLIKLNQPEEARDYIASVHERYSEQVAGNARVREFLVGLDAEALRRVDPEAAGEALQGLEESPTRLLNQARFALADSNLATAVERLSELVKLEELTASAGGQALALLPALAEGGRRDDAERLLGELRSRFGQEQALQRPFEEAEIFIASEDPAQRDERLLEFIANEPDETNRIRRYYQFYLQRGEMDQARRYLSQLEQKLPDDVAVFEAQFELALREGDLESATGYSLKLAELNADLAGGATYRGRLRLQQGRPEEAARELEAARDKLPRSSELQTVLGQSQLAAGRLLDGIESLQEAVQLNPHNFAANKLLYIAYQQPGVTPEMKPADGGLSYLRRARELNPQDPFIQEQAQYLAEEESPRKAITEREQRREQQPQDFDNLLRLAQLYIRVGDNTKAAACMQDAAQIDASSAQLAQLISEFYSALGQRREGEMLLRAFIDAQSGQGKGDAYVILSNFYDRLGDGATAEQALQQAVRAYESEVGDPAERQELLAQGYLRLVQFYRQHQQPEPMITAARRALDQLAPNDARAANARLVILQGLFAMNRLGEAEEAVQAFQRDFPENANGKLMLAALKLRQQDWDKALRTYGEVLQERPDHLPALRTYARLLGYYGRYSEAREALRRAKRISEEAVAIRPNSEDARLFPDVALELAELYEQMGDLEEAERELRALLDAAGRSGDPNERDFREQALVDRLVTLLHKAGKVEEARQLVSEFKNRYPTSAYWASRLAQAWFNRGDELKRLGRTADAKMPYAEAARYYQEAVQLAQQEVQAIREQMQAVGQRNDPRLAALTRRLNSVSNFSIRWQAFRIEALTMAGQPEEALATFERLRAAAQGNLPAILRAAALQAYRDLGRHAEAMQELRAGLADASQAGSGMVSSVVGLALQYYSRSDLLEVLREALEQAAPQSEASYRLRNALAGVLLNERKLVEVQEVTAPIVAEAPADSPERVMAINHQAQALEFAEDFPAAIERYRQVLEAAPDDVVALNNLAYLLLEHTDRHQEALQLARQARELLPTDPQVLDTLGWAYYRQGEVAEAEAAFQRAVNLDPEHVPANLHLGQLLADRGRTHEARTTLQKAKALAAKQGLTDYEAEIDAALAKLP